MRLYSTAAESSEENTSFLEKCYNEVSSVPDEVNSNSSRKQESYLQQGQKVTYVHLCYCLQKSVPIND